MSKFKVSSSSIFINDIDVSDSVCGFNLFAQAGSPTRIEVTLSGNVEVECDGKIIVILPGGQELEVKK